MKPPLTIQRRSELMLAKLNDLMALGPVRNPAEGERRNQEFRNEVEIHCRGAIRGMLRVMADKFEEMGGARLNPDQVADMLRNAESEFRNEPEQPLWCPACDRAFEDHARFYIGDHFDTVICLGLPVDKMIMIGPGTAREFRKEAERFTG